MSSAIQPYLQVVEAGATRTFIFSGEPVLIGRTRDCTVVLSDSLASRNHCVIERIAGGFQIRDLGSRNGTLVNGRRTEATFLSPGDEVRIGYAVLTLIDPTHTAPEEDIEELSEDDVIDPAPGAGVGSDAGAFSAVRPVDDPDQALTSLAAALPADNLTEATIVLANGRGQRVGGVKAGVAIRAPREPADLFRLLILVALRSRATDIHIEPRRDHYGIRLRVDGDMVDVARLTSAIGIRFATFVKVICDLDIAQRNAMQEGRFSSVVPSRIEGRESRRIDYRVSFAPAVFGQKAVIRVLDEENAPLSVVDLNLPTWMREALQIQIEQDAGMVLVAGPTGSGKTTTLYSLLRGIELDRRNVVTIEDPVEMQIAGTTQMPVDEGSGKSFANILRSVLRQDPDVIMVGEVRDAETARTAMQAAITGHLVLSTIHTRDTIGTIYRLLDLGIEPYLVGQALNLVVAQRLVRRLCQFCRKKVTPTEAQRKEFISAGLMANFTYAPVGCPKCLGTGHLGRRAVFELLTVDARIRAKIQASASESELTAALEGTKFVSLHRGGLRLVVEGQVSYDEIHRIHER
jgi:general secretion pathway protein E